MVIFYLWPWSMTPRSNYRLIWKYRVLLIHFLSLRLDFKYILYRYMYIMYNAILNRICLLDLEHYLPQNIKKNITTTPWTRVMESNNLCLSVSAKVVTNLLWSITDRTCMVYLWIFIFMNVITKNLYESYLYNICKIVIVAWFYSINMCRVH